MKLKTVEQNKANSDFSIKTYNKANNPKNCISCDGILKYPTIKRHPYLVPSSIFRNDFTQESFRNYR